MPHDLHRRSRRNDHCRVGGAINRYATMRKWAGFVHSMHGFRVQTDVLCIPVPNLIETHSTVPEMTSAHSIYFMHWVHNKASFITFTTELIFPLFPDCTLCIQKSAYRRKTKLNTRCSDAARHRSVIPLSMVYTTHGS